MGIGEETGSMPERCTCRERFPKNIKRESDEDAKERLVKRIADGIARTISQVFMDRGNYLLQNACGTTFLASNRPVSKTVKKQALREAFKRIMADADKLIEPPKNCPAEPSSYQERARSLLR